MDQQINLEQALKDARDNHYSLACKCLNYLMVRASDKDIVQILSTGRINAKVLPTSHVGLFNIWLSFVKSDAGSLSFKDFKEFCDNRAFKINNDLLTVDGTGISSVFSLSDKWVMLEQACIACRALQFHTQQINELTHGKTPDLNTIDDYSKALVLDSVIKPISTQDFIDIITLNINNQLNPESIIIPTYFKHLDSISGGMYKGDLTVVCARPGTGKTLLALNVVLNHFRLQKSSKIAFFSAEMTKASLLNRFFYGAVNSYTKNGVMCGTNITFNDVKAHAMAKVEASKQIFNDFVLNAKTQLIIDDANGQAMTIEHIENQLQAMSYDTLPQVVIIDYYQRLDSTKFFKTKLEKLSYISQRLTECAKRFNVAFLVVAQLRRQSGNSDESYHPTLDDIADCDQLGKDASLVANLSSYKADDDGTARNFTALEIVKNRHGSLGLIELKVQGGKGLINEIKQLETFPKVFKNKNGYNKGFKNDTFKPKLKPKLKPLVDETQEEQLKVMTDTAWEEAGL